MNDSNDLDEAIAPKFVSRCFEQIVGLTQTANSLPEKDELGFYKRIPSCNQNFKTANSLVGEAIKLLSDFCLKDNKIDPQKTIKYANIIDVLDTCLENVDLTLDKIKDHAKEEKSLFMKDHGSQIKDGSTDTKSQRMFKDAIDNSEEYPFIPKITHKYNSTIPINEKILLAQYNKVEFFKNIQNPPDYEFPHPYEEELNNLEYQDFQFDLQINSQLPVPLKPDTFSYIDNFETFQQLIQDLKKDNIKEIAVDLEHHSYRSFQGFTCLMQLSTREKDYIIDTLSLRDALHELNETFTNPKIVKVLHGADMDIEWLQKDFGIYVVNMFDTGQASRFLQLPSSGLAYLMKEICKVTANKEYQTADWRKRPLPQEMVKYAREDTHYLLYIYDEMRKKIIEKAKESNSNPIECLKSVLNKSKMICLKTYRKPKLKSDHYYDIMNKNKPILSNKKFQLLKAIYKWRDTVARLEDESTGYILPMNYVFEIMEMNSKSPNEIYSKIKRINFATRKHINELVEEIKSVNEKFNDIRKADNEKMTLDLIAPVKINNFTNLSLIPSFPDIETSSVGQFKLLEENDQIKFQSLNQSGKNESPHDYHEIFSSQSSTNRNRNKYENVKKSFNYGSLYDYAMSLQPNFKNDILSLQIEYEKASKEKRARALELNNQQLNQANLENQEGYIEFKQEKGVAPKKEKPQYSLGLENTSEKNKELPKSLKEQYKVQVNKRQRNKSNKKKEQEAERFDEKVKKIKTNLEEAKSARKIENKYEALMNSSDEEEMDAANLVSKANRKAFQKFWEKNSRLDAEDPLQNFLKPGTNPQRQGSKKKKINFQKNRYSRKGVQK